MFGHQPVQKQVLIFSPVEKQANINLIINAFAILDIKCHIKQNTDQFSGKASQNSLLITALSLSCILHSRCPHSKAAWVCW